MTPDKASRIGAAGEMAELIRRHDWSATPLGAIGEWPPENVGSVNLMLGCRFPAVLLLGPEMVQLYNDAYLPLMAEKHPRALGQTARECWAEAWHLIGSQWEAVLATGETTYRENVVVPVLRHGKLRQIYWTYSYSPVYASGRVAGIFVVCHDTTAEVLAKRERDAVAEQLKQVLEVTTDAVVSIDRAWRITYANAPARKAISAGVDLIGKNVWEQFPLAVYEGSPFQEHYGRAMDERIGAEFQVFYPGHLNIWLDVSVKPGRNGIVVFFRDVSEQRRAEAARRESEELERLALQAGGFGAWKLNLRTRQSERTVVHDRIFGYDTLQPEWNFDRFLEHVLPDEREKLKNALQEALAANRDWEFEAPILRADGVHRWIWAKGRIFGEENGRPEKMIGLVADITSRKAAKLEAAKLLEERQRFFFLAETSQDFTGMYDLAGRLVYTNPAARVLLGFEDSKESNLRNFFFEEDQAFVMEEFLPRLLREGHGEVELRFRHFRTGEPVWMSCQAMVLRNAGGEPNGFATVSRDMTVKKQQTAALMQTEKLAAVGRLAASIAHEINNPLESVTNLLYLANNSSELTEIKQFLDLAELELRRVSVISNQTLRFHKQSTHPTLANCYELLGSALSIYESRIANARIRVEKRKRANQPVFCFEGEIRQVLSNLVGNAVDAMHGTGGRLLVRSRTATEWTTGRRGIVLTLADTGTGIPAAALLKIFDPFFTTKGEGGTGLGLWVSQEIVARHHGALRVRSSQRESCHGTVFSLFLPFDAARPPVAVQ